MLGFEIDYLFLLSHADDDLDVVDHGSSGGGPRRPPISEAMEDSYHQVLADHGCAQELGESSSGEVNLDHKLCPCLEMCH